MDSSGSGSIRRPSTIDSDAFDAALLSPGQSQSKRLIIGQPVIFPDGIGTNYVSDRYVSRFREGSPLTERSSSSSSIVPFSRFKNYPQAGQVHGRRSYSEDENYLPPRHRRTRNRLIEENMKANGRYVTVNGITQDVTEKDIHDLIQDSGFSANLITVAVSQDLTASLEFSHSHVASAACSVLQHRARNWWNRTNGNAGKRPTENRFEAVRAPEVIDLTAVTDILNDDPYRNLEKDIYADDGDSDSEMSLSPSPNRPLSPEIADMNLTSDILRDGIGTHLSNAFELSGAVLGMKNNLMNTRGPKADRRKASSSRTTLPSSRNISRNDTYVVNLPKSPHNKPRRVLLPKGTANLPIITVSMRADVQFIDVLNRHRISRFSIPNDTVYRHAVDAIMIGDTAVICYGNGPCQASLVRFSSQAEGHSPSLTELKHRAHKISLDAGSTTGKGAVSCLAAKGKGNNATQFFTGGYDKTLRLWTVGNSDLITTERLNTLTTIPEALGFRDGSLLVGTSRKILKVDLGHLSSTPTIAQLSNAIYQIHIHDQAPNLTILEVNSLDFQVQIFDDRIKRGFDRAADCYFGARQARSLARSTRGDTHFSLFVKGYDDGTVRMWDYRNSKKPILTNKYQDIGNIVHTVFAGSNIICYGENSLTFIDNISGDTI